MRLLLVEDETTLARHLKRGLESLSYAVDVAQNGEEATDLAIENEYDVILLDVMLPDGSGVELLRAWRLEGLDTPTLMLTACDAVADRVRGLDAGADDYLTKPFAFEELSARVRSLLRRPRTTPAPTLTFADLKLDRSRQQAARGDIVIDLTAKEFALLEQLMLQPGRVLSRSQLADHAWDSAYEARSNVIDVLMGRLRRKLEVAGRKRLISTVKGVGYALRATDAHAP